MTEQLTEEKQYRELLADLGSIQSEHKAITLQLQTQLAEIKMIKEKIQLLQAIKEDEMQ